MKKEYYKLFEVTSDGTTRILTLPTGELLKDSKILAVEAYHNGGFGTKGANQATVASLTDCYLKLSSLDGKIMVDNLPLQRINPLNNQGKRFDLIIERINPSDCQLIISAAAIPAAGQVFQIAFYYEKTIC